MKVLILIYRWVTARCVYCGAKKEQYSPVGGSLLCPTDMGLPFLYGCSHRKIFIKPKEAKVQRALGFLSGPKGF